MSYSALSAFGLNCPAQAGAAAGARTAHCRGNERAENCPEQCCPVSTFNNGTYGTVKSEQSLRYWNEKRVRYALAHILTRTTGGSDSPLDDYAYDKGALPPTALVARVRRAKERYYQLYPADAWYKKADCRSTECQSDGYYSCYRHRNLKSTPERLTLVKRLSGATLTPSQYEFPIKDVPVAYGVWVSKVSDAIAHVPGGAAAANHRSMTSHSDWNRDADAQYASTKLVQMSKGRVVPGPWLTKFLNAFDPLFDISKTRAIIPRSERVKGVLQLQKLRVRTIQQTADLRPEPAVSKSLIAAGVILVGGGAFLLARRAARKSR